MAGYVYPRLPMSIARTRLDEMRELSEADGVRGLKSLVSAEHPRAAPVATGGVVASPEQISDVREAVLEAVRDWWIRGELPRHQVNLFDVAIGETLHREMAIVPADAGHVETWNFLSLVVMPDIAALRFPALHTDRILGTPRNALRRAWQRHEVLGSVLTAGSKPLGEDELVGLFERTALARNRRLLVRLAQAVVDYDGEARSAWARRLFKQVVFTTGPRLLDGLSDSELDQLVADHVRGVGVSGRSTAPSASARVDDIESADTTEGLSSGHPTGADDGTGGRSATVGHHSRVRPARPSVLGRFLGAGSAEGSWAADVTSDGPDFAWVALELAERGPISNADLREATGLGVHQARQLLSQLVAEGKLRRTGAKRGTRYHLLHDSTE